MTKQELIAIVELYNADVPRRQRDHEAFCKAYPDFPWKLIKPEPLTLLHLTGENKPRVFKRRTSAPMGEKR